MPREFKLPDNDQISKKQGKLIRWDGRGIKLVIGGPGTGKTTVGLIQAQKMLNAKRRCICLMYNNTLKHMSSQLIKMDIEVETWIKWFGRFVDEKYRLHVIPRNWDTIYAKHFNKKFPNEVIPDDWASWAEDRNPIYFQNRDNPPPEFAHAEICRLLGISSSTTSHYYFDWDKIEQIYLDKDNQIQKDKETFIIIDEGQDFPPQFYSFMKHHFANILVTADENQTITDSNSKCREIADRLDLSENEEDEDIVDLTKNYRNTRQIADLGNKFRPVSAVSLPIDNNIEKEGEVPLLKISNHFESMILPIADQFIKYPARLIGVITPNDDKIRYKYYENIKNYINRKGGNIHKVYTYYSKDKDRYREIDYADGGIAVLCAASCKGLGFDEVFIADVNCFNLNLDDKETFQKNMYVQITRAMDNLVILYNSNNPNENILQEFSGEQTLIKITEIYK